MKSWRKHLRQSRNYEKGSMNKLTVLVKILCPVSEQKNQVVDFSLGRNVQMSFQELIDLCSFNVNSESSSFLFRLPQQTRFSTHLCIKKIFPPRAIHRISSLLDFTVWVLVTDVITLSPRATLDSLDVLELHPSFSCSISCQAASGQNPLWSNLRVGLSHSCLLVFHFGVAAFFQDFTFFLDLLSFLASAYWILEMVLFELLCPFCMFLLDVLMMYYIKCLWS